MSGESRRVDSTPTRLRSLADFYPDGILGATRDGVITILNAQGAALLGVDAEQALGLPLAEVLKLLDQDGRTWWGSTVRSTASRSSAGVPEQSWLLPDGDEVLTTARLVRSDTARAGRRHRRRAAQRPRPGPAWTASGPTWSRRSPTSCARRSPA